MSEEKKIKLVIWDLDNTLWDGVLAEGDNLKLKNGIKDIIEELDQRGILQSIASRNNYDEAMEYLKSQCIDQYFLYPHINWNSKSVNIKEIIKLINIGENTVAFIDDQEFERAEVNHHLPDIICIDSINIGILPDMEIMKPRFITAESKHRRNMYASDINRKKYEETYEGPQDEFLASLGMKLSVCAAREDDLMRAEELTVRTHQLNSTGFTYSYEELKSFIADENYHLLVADLSDNYGAYGKIGLILIHCDDDVWTIRLLLTSCRVISRGIGSTLLGLIINLSLENHKKLNAIFVPTPQNRIIDITFTMMGFQCTEEQEGQKRLMYFGNKKFDIPSYIDVKIDIVPEQNISSLGEVS